MSRKQDFSVAVFPFLRWFSYYSSSHLRADFVSGLTVALVLIPQSMAYAQLAGLPPYYGLYAALLPPIIAALFGSSNQLATGPVAVVSLMTATALAPLATQGSAHFVSYAILLALMVGLFQFGLGVLRLGLVVNFLSHPVVNGFTNAAAIIIATSQLSKIFGVYVERAEHHYEEVYEVLVSALHCTHWPTLAFAVLAFVIMATLRKLNPRIPNVLIAVIVTTILSVAMGFERNVCISLDKVEDPLFQQGVRKFNYTLTRIDQVTKDKLDVRAEAREEAQKFGAKSARAIELNGKVAILDLQIQELKKELGAYQKQLWHMSLQGVKDAQGEICFYVHQNVPPGFEGDGQKWRLKVGNSPLDENRLTFMGGGAVVGTIPRGVPRFALPRVNLPVMLDLFTMAVIISLLGFMEAISIAKAMAAKTGQHLDPNQELIGQGLANIVGSLNASYPVSGSFSRSAVNIQAGAVTGLSNAFSSLVVLVTLLFLTPLLYHLPQSVLAAIIIMAVINLVNPGAFIQTWHAQRYDGAIAIITFVATLGFAPHLDKGIMIGVALSLGHFLFRTIKPEMALLSKWEDGTFRNADRRGLLKCRHIAVIRFNNSLFFATVNYLEEKILEPIAEMPELRHIHVVANGINELDSSGVEVLAGVVKRVREAGYDFSMSGLNDHVAEAMKRTGLLDRVGADHVYGNVELAVKSIYRRTHERTRETRCPLLECLRLSK